jgi:hypothetical protein
MIPKSTSIKKEYRDYTVWVNKQGQAHREDGPAFEYNNGDKSWWINGKLHRLDGPACIWTDRVGWSVNGCYIGIY